MHIDVSAADLIRPGSKGTMIIGGFRMGSHFLRDICNEHAKTMGLTSVAHPEWQVMDVNEPLGRLQAYRADPRYHVVIINIPEVKRELLRTKDTLPDWLVVRLVHEDIERWFCSWFYYNYAEIHIHESLTGPRLQTARLDGQQVLFRGNGDSGDYYSAQNHAYHSSWTRAKGAYVDDRKVGTCLASKDLHHGTPADIYRQFLSEYLPDREHEILERLCHSVHNNMLSALIPADIELDYAQLSQMATPKVEWQPNTYPDIQLTSMFRYRVQIQYLLSQWRQPWPGLFKEST